MTAATDLQQLGTSVLQAPRLESALRPVLGLLRVELKRLGMSLGAMQSPAPAHHPAGDYARREWLFDLVDPSVPVGAPHRTVVLALELTLEGMNEGRSMLLVEERPLEVTCFDWNQQCRSELLLDTLGVDGWAAREQPVESLLAAMEADGLLDPLEDARPGVLRFAQGFQP